MKFGKHLVKMIELSDPEWGPYWLNYKFMKKKINDIVKAHGAVKVSDPASASNPLVISQSPAEVEFFRLIRTELKKTSNHFSCAEQLCEIRLKRVKEAYVMFHDNNITYDKKTWTRLLMTCVKFYKDILLLENFAIINYCGFSKILKKHDKSTGYSTREAFMRNVMSHQNFTHYPDVLHLLQESEKLYIEIQGMERFCAVLFSLCDATVRTRPVNSLYSAPPFYGSFIPLKDEERLFIDAIRGLNTEAGKLLAGENNFFSSNECTSSAL